MTAKIPIEKPEDMNEADGKTRITVAEPIDNKGRIAEDRGDMYTFRDDDGNILLTLTPEEASNLAWQMERRLVEAMGGKKMPDVWVLSWRRLLTGDAAGEGAELIGGGERIYVTKEGAMSDLPYLLMEFVKDAHPEGHFGSDEEGIGEKVKEIMNDASNSGRPDRWLYDGSTQSFEVELSLIPVRP